MVNERIKEFGFGGAAGGGSEGEEGHVRVVQEQEEDVSRLLALLHVKISEWKEKAERQGVEKEELTFQLSEATVSAEEKKRRIIKLNDLQRGISLEVNQVQVGQTQLVLVEQDRSKKSENEVQGRNEANTIVILPKGDLKMGDWVNVKITDATVNILKGEVVG